MSYRKQPWSSLTVGSTSRGTARSTRSSGLPRRADSACSTCSRARIVSRAAVEETTMSAVSSSGPRASSGSGFAAEALGKRGGAVECPVCDEGELRAATDEVARGELADLARADDHDAAAGKVAEDLCGEGGGGRGDGRRALPDRGLGPHSLACVQRLAEEPVEERPDRPALVGRPHLPLDLAFARHERVEPGSDAEQVGGGGLLLQSIEVRLELRARDPAEVRERGRCAITGGIGVSSSEVELGAVAGRETNRFAALAQPPGQRRLAFAVQGDALAHLDGREPMGSPDDEQLHATWANSSPSWRTMTAATPPRASTAASSRRPARTRR